MIFDQRADARYFLTMNYQEPDTRGDSHDPYVVLNRLRTLLITLDALEFCDQCDHESAQYEGDTRSLKKELEKKYQVVDQVFTQINAFAEEVVTYFDQHAPSCKPCQTMFRVGATAAQAMQDCIYDNPETPDETWLSESRCLSELFTSRQNKSAQAGQPCIPISGKATE